MADIFLGYSRKNMETAKNFAQLFKRLGYSVFWDVNVPVGETWDKYIPAQIKKSKAVVILWSARSAESDWVKEEAHLAKKLKKLVPIKIGRTDPPYGFAAIQTADLVSWKNNFKNNEWKKVVQKLEELTGKEAKKIRNRAPKTKKRKARRKKNNLRLKQKR